MFWGYIIEPKERYMQVNKRLHVSMAALDLSTADDSPTQCLFYYKGRNYLLCTLQKNQQVQCALDLNFAKGDVVVFTKKGNGNIHLSGYSLDDDELEKEEADLKAMEEILTTLNKRVYTAYKPEMPLKKSIIEQHDEVDNYNSANDMNFSDDDAEEEEDSDGTGEDDVAEESDQEEESAEEEQEDDGEEEIIKPKVSPKKQKKHKPKPKSKQTPEKKKESPTKPEKQTPAAQKKQVAGGVIIEDLRTGMGKIASNGKNVIVKYEGRLKSNNKVFNSSGNQGLKFRLGRQEVLKGCDVGVVGMKVGGKRRITCPPNMAYGAKGDPPTIPPNSTLVFEVELKNVL